MNLIKAFILRDFSIEKKYRFGFLMKVAGILFQLAIFYFVGRLVTGYDYFPFVFVGLVFSRFFQFWINVFTENIRMEQFWGTAELLFLSPGKPLKVMLASSSGKFMLLLCELLFYAAAGAAVFHFNFPLAAVPALLPFFALQCVIFAGLGLAAAAFVMFLKRGDPLGVLLIAAFDLLSGVYFPVKLLPRGLKTISNILPTTAALDSWRAVILAGTAPSGAAIAVQFCWAVFAAAAGVIGFGIAYRTVRVNGELGNY